jgi:nifR3 family TIM-barrel protein
MDSFWSHLRKPFFVLAPMADVTDPAYRTLIQETGAPDVFWTEFVSADGLYATRTRGILEDAENPLMRDLQFQKGEHPIVAQIFGNRPETIRYAAQLAAELGFDGVDINMGCPDKAIEKQGAGASMMKHPEDAPAIIRAAKESGLPVSVKTRIGYNRDEMDTWLPILLKEDLAALTVHLRTRKEMSLVPAHWEYAHRVVALRDQYAPGTLVLGNGDVVDIKDAQEKIKNTGLDGVMLGRAIFGNPWLFTDRDYADITPKERIEALLKLSQYFDELRPRKSFHIMKKHFKAFIKDWDGASTLRSKLMETTSHEELSEVLGHALKLIY